MKSLETRINAMIPYFFLWPLILFARKGTPLADPYVQNHAKRASLVMAIGILSYIVYLFLRPMIAFSVFGIYGPTLILSIIEAILFWVLLLGMYQAYRGIEIENLFQWKTLSSNSQLKKQEYSEEQKIQIVASFLPFVGVFMAEKYSNPEIKIGAKMANFFLVLFLFSQIFAGGSLNTASFFISFLYILFFTANAVYIFWYSSFFVHKIYDMIPTWHQIEAHIMSSIEYIFEFFKVAFGQKRQISYSKKYSDNFQKITKKVPVNTKFWTHPGMIALPFVNLLTLSSLWNKKYEIFRPAIIEGIFLSVLFALEIYFYGFSHPYFILLLIPVITIFARVEKNTNIHAPITGLVFLVMDWSKKTQEKIENIQHNQKKESFVYPEKKSPPKTPQNTQTQKNLPK